MGYGWNDLKEDVEKVRAAADLYDIVSATVTLQPSGTGTFVGLCPFHDEKTPSFSVRPALGVWHCFGCGLGGDVFGYVEHQENIDFREAVELLADKYHIELHYENSGGRRAFRSKRAGLLEANEEAQEFFVSQMMSKEALAARKLSADAISAGRTASVSAAGTRLRGGIIWFASCVQGVHAAGDARRRACASGAARRIRLFPRPRHMADS